MINGEVKLASRALSKEALEKYPPKMMCKGIIKLGNQKIDTLDSSIFDYAYRHQLPINITVRDAKKQLGDVDDPIQYEAEQLINKDFVIPPRPFPDAMPCSISLDNNVIFDYILLRVEKISDDGIVVLSNEGQNISPFKITIRVNETTKETTFSFRIQKPSNNDSLTYIRFMKQVSCGSQILIKALQTGECFVKGEINSHNYKSGFETIEQEIDFFERVVLIEEYFEKPLDIPDEIYGDEYSLVNFIACLISGEKHQGSWLKKEFTLILDDKNKVAILTMDNIPCDISYVGSLNISIFGEQYSVPIIRTYKNAKIDNIEKLKKKVGILETGDSVKIVFSPGNENGTGILFDMLHPGQENNVTLNQKSVSVE